jgi:hypothetical protein
VNAAQFEAAERTLIDFAGRDHHRSPGVAQGLSSSGSSASAPSDEALALCAGW